MSNNDTQCVVFRSNNHYFESEPSLNRVLSDSIEFDAGDVIYVPAYKMQYVDDIVTPAIPAKPVEPAIGLSWKRNGTVFRIIDMFDGKWVVYYRAETGYIGTIYIYGDRLEDYVRTYGYPTTKASPAVTRTVRIWVKL